MIMLQATLNSEYLSPRQVEALTGIAATTLANWRWANRGPQLVRMGRSIRYPREALQDRITAHKLSPEIF